MLEVNIYHTWVYLTGPVQLKFTGKPEDVYLYNLII